MHENWAKNKSIGQIFSVKYWKNCWKFKFSLFSDNVTRPILIVGPLSEAVLDKLLSDYPDKFARCEPEYMNCDQEALEKV